MGSTIPEQLVTAFWFVAGIAAALVVYNLFVDFSGTKDQQVALNNLQALQKAMNDVAASASEFFLGDLQFNAFPNYIVVGFSKDDNFVGDVCGYSASRNPPYEVVDKPKRPECSQSSCICLYPETYGDDDFDEKDYPISCLSVKADKIFTLDYLYQSYLPNGIKYSEDERVWKNTGGYPITLTNVYPENLGNFNYASLFIYGQCEDHYSDINFGIQKLFIEKTIKEGKTYLFVAPSKTTNIDQRQRALFKSKESLINPQA